MPRLDSVLPFPALLPDLIRQSVLHTFRFLDPPLQPMEAPHPASAQHWIIAEIAIMGNTQATLTLELPPQTARGVLRQLTGFEVVVEREENLELFAELIRLLGFELANRLAKMQWPVRIGLSKVEYRPGKTRADSLPVPFRSREGPFQVYFQVDAC